MVVPVPTEGVAAARGQVAVGIVARGGTVEIGQLVGVIVGRRARRAVDRLRQAIAVRIVGVGDDITIGIVDFGEPVEQVEGVGLGAGCGEDGDAVAGSVVGVAEALQRAAGVVVGDAGLLAPTWSSGVGFATAIQFLRCIPVRRVNQIIRGICFVRTAEGDIDGGGVGVSLSDYE